MATPETAVLPKFLFQTSYPQTSYLSSWVSSVSTKTICQSHQNFQFTTFLLFLSPWAPTSSFLRFKFHHFGQSLANNNLCFYCISLAKCYFWKHPTIFLCAHPCSGASGENYSVEKICRTLNLWVPASIGPSTLPQILPFPSGQIIFPSFYFKPLSLYSNFDSPFMLIICLSSFFFWGSSSDWNRHVFCHRTCNLSARAYILSSS